MTAKKRIAFIDFHRGLALIVMIEVHVFNSLLSAEIKSQSWFSILNFVNGLVAPSFLFVSGFAFILAAEKKAGELRKYSHSFWRQIGRILLIFFTGYSLHLPFHSLSRTLTDSTPEQLQSFFAVDILQTIAVGLFFLLTIILLFKKENLHFFSFVTGAFFFILFAPIIWNFRFDSFLPVYLSDYLNTDNGSLFPLFPWLSFMFFGSVFGKVYLKLKETNSGKKFENLIFYLALFLIVIGHLFTQKNFPLYIKLSLPNYFFFTMRLGYVLLILYVSKLITEKFDFSKSFILDVSRESLLVYWLHLVILFGQFWKGKSINEIAKNGLTLWEVLITTIILIVAMIFSAIQWGRIKAAKPAIARKTLLAAISVFLIYFLIS